jgi:hypothetical protein
MLLHFFISISVKADNIVSLLNVLAKYNSVSTNLWKVNTSVDPTKKGHILPARLDCYNTVYGSATAY